MADGSWVDVRQDDRGVAIVTIDNAAKLNTLNTPVMSELIAAVERLGADDALRVVVLRGAGERAFIGGADITEMAALDPASARAFITLVHRSCDVFRRLPVPVIARIEGYVFGRRRRGCRRVRHARCRKRIAVRHAGGTAWRSLRRGSGSAAAIDRLGPHAATAADRRYHRCGDRTRLGVGRGSCSGRATRSGGGAGRCVDPGVPVRRRYGCRRR